MTFEGKRIHNGSSCSNLLLELIVILIIPIPQNQHVITDYYENSGKDFVIKQYLNDYFLAFMWFRVLYLMRALYNFSIYSDAYAKRLCA